MFCNDAPPPSAGMFCIHPQEWFRQKERVGGTKNVNIKKVIELQPDLIIANKEENVQEQVEELAKDFPVWISDVNNLPEALQMIEWIGSVCGKTDESVELSKEIKTKFNKVQAAKNILILLAWN